VEPPRSAPALGPHPADQHPLDQAHHPPPLTWPCPGCGQQVTDLAPGGRPLHAELGHAAGCARLARDQAADDALRRDWLARLVLHADHPAGPVRRHWLAGQIHDDCPRCGWHGSFHHHLATVDGDWAGGAVQRGQPPGQVIRRAWRL